MNCSNENIDVIVKYDDFLQDNIEEMFKQVDSAYKQKKIYSNNFNVIEAEKIHIGFDFKSSDQNKIEEIQHFGYGVPMLPSLQKLLDTLPNQLVSHKINQTIKTNVFDGKHMKKKK